MADGTSSSANLKTPGTGAANAGHDENASLAVVGIACRFPGGCDSPEAFWDFLKAGVDATSEVPADR